MTRIGYAQLKGKYIQFDDVGWAMIKRIAKRTKTAPKKIVIAAIKRAHKKGLL